MVMSESLYIPAATQEKLNAIHPKGTRHQAKIDIAMGLLGNGIPPTAVQQTLVDKFPDASLSEIDSVIRWCMERQPTPSGFGKPNGTFKSYRPAQPKKSEKIDPAAHCDWWLNGEKVTPAQMTERSPIAFRGTVGDELITFLEQLYTPDEKLNVVCKFTLNKDGKANPIGGGQTITRAEWVEWVQKRGVPQSEAGAWLRMNPCQNGTGANGSITDADVTAWKFMLLESDAVPIETQLALFNRLKLPIAAIISSGGKSVHAWLKLDSKSADEYSQMVKSVMELLEPFGIDQSNKNASRLSRLPSAKRTIKAAGDGMQSLIYLDSNCAALTAEAVEQLKARLSLPVQDGCPMRSLVLDALPRFDELYNNRGKLGVQIGFDEFDRDTGGFKPGQMTVIAAGTNQGKSTVALNIVNGAITRNHGVALFTLEMDREEILDLIVANNCRVNRNCFNTGYFESEDFQKIEANIGMISKLPLWIFDEATMTVSDIRQRVDALKSEHKIEMVVIDYVQIVTPNDSNLPREQQVAEIARSIRIMAKQTKLPFIILSQLNDDGKLRESRVVAHEAHNVIVLEPNEDQTLMGFKVIKGRRIMKKDYELIYEPQYSRVFSPPMPNIE